MKKTTILSLASCLLGLSVLTAQSAPEPVRIARVTDAPVIDGHLDDPVWAEATHIDAFVLLSSGAQPSQATEAWLATDGRYLYIAVRAHELDLRSLRHNVTRRDGAVHGDDSIEIFLDPGTHGARYYHFILNCANVQADQIMERGLPEREWDAEWESATFFDPLQPENGWTAEVALPLHLFRAQAGDGPWRLNICRNKQTAPSEFITWGRLRGAFHEPEHFPLVAGLDDAAPPDLFMPVLRSAETAPYRLHDGQLVYAVRGELMNDGGRPGTALLTARDKPVKGEPAETVLALELGALERRAFELTVLVAAPGERTVQLRLRAGDDEEARQTLMPDMDGLNPLQVYPDRNYYTHETHARLLAVTDIAAAAARAAGLRLTAAVADTVLAEAEIEDGETALAVPLADFSSGETPVVVALRDPDGALLGQRTVLLRRHAPAPDGVAEVKIDHEYRRLLVNDEPFFPIGICSPHLSDDWLALYRDLGFNTIIRWTGIGRNHAVSGALTSLDRMQRHGLMMIDNPLAFLKTDLQHRGVLRPAGMAQAVEEMGDFLEAVRNHPALLAYYGLDEAPERGLEEPLQDFLTAVRAADPYHPVYISGSGPSRLDRFDFADILGRHIYWCPIGAPPLDEPNRIARVVRWNVEHINEPNRSPFFFMPQAEITSHSRRSLTPQERRVTVYLGLIHGARSLFYFVAPIRHRATADNLRELSAEAQALAPALLRRTLPQRIDVRPAPAAGDLPAVQALLAEHPEDGLLLLAANSLNRSVEAEWDLQSLGAAVAVTDYFGGEPRPLADGILLDRFEPYGTRVYRLAGAQREGAKVRIGLTLDVAPEAAVEAPAAPGPAARNLLINSSFEEAALPGWPDSWWFGYPAPDRMAGDPGGPGQDFTTAYHGRASLRLHNPYDHASGLVHAMYRHEFGSGSLRGGIPVEPGKTYVFSAYMKAEEAGTDVEVLVCNFAGVSWVHEEGAQKRFTLTTDWQRYSVTVTYPETGWTRGLRPDLGIIIWHRRGAGNSVWIDAVQLEEGSEPTAYQPAEEPEGGRSKQ